MSLNDFAYFQVSLKTILRKEDSILLLITPDGYYDFPGGRIDKSEINLNFNDVLARELREELGNDLKFKTDNVAFVSKRFYDKNNTNYHILATFFEAQWLEGNITLSNEHTKSRWIKPHSILINPEKFISKDEYIQYKYYCDSNYSKTT